ncbi:MAG: D-2-hydroxyacid dehydrogenase [Ruminococcaceae bacterium]|nr:D-2-hydroxyacid dehydrogenase [Oscillospiraceae bacterium]
MKIVITDRATLGEGIDLGLIGAFGELVIYPHTNHAELIERIADADILICNKTVVDKEALDAAKNLRCILLFATGYNNIDISYAAERGIAVCNAGQYSTYAVAQHTFALMLRQASRVAEYSDFVLDGGWIRSPLFSAFEYSTHELYGKTLGIIGFGSIGRAVCDIALAFGMKVLVYTRTPKEDDRVEFVSFDTLLASSDYISAHCPLTDKTAKMFNASAFEKCKKGAYFINTSRGGVVDEIALADALNSEKLSGAALDVLATEPMSANCPLIGAKNLTITPHVAWIPVETRQRLIGIVADNLKAFLDGTPKNKVN